MLNQYPYIIVPDIESLLKKMDTCNNDPSKSSTEKINEHEMCEYSLFTDCSFNKKVISCKDLKIFKNKNIFSRFKKAS